MRTRTKVKWAVMSLAAVLAAAIVSVYAILASIDFDDWRGVIEAEAMAATGRTLSIAGPVDLRVSLTPAIAIENVSFGNAAWGTWPELLSVRRLEVEVRLLPLLTGDIEVRRLLVIEPTILLETSADGRANWVIETATPEAPRDAPAGPAAIPAFHRIDVRDGNLLFRDGATGQEINVALTRLEGAAETPASPADISLAAVYNGIEIQADGAIGSRDRFLSGAAFPLDLRVSAANTTFELTGEIAEPAAGKGLDLQIDVRGERLADLNALAGQDLPTVGPYRLAARLSDTERGYKLTGLAATLGTSDLAGNATVALDGARPKISGTLNSTNLDIGDFRGRDRPAGADGGEGEGKRFLLSDDPLPLDVLTAIDANIKLTADQIRLDDRTFISEATLIALLEAGRLRITDLAAGLSGGQLTGTLTVDAAQDRPPITVNLSAKGFDYGHFLQGRDITDGVSGDLDATARLSGTGASPRDWASSLDGRVDLVGGEGRVRSDLLSASGAGLINVFSAWREADNDLRLNCVVMRLPVKGGVVGTQAVLVDTAAVTVGITGTVDLRDESIDLKVTPQAKRTSLMSLAVPLRVGGTFVEPSVGPDAIGTAVGAAKIAGMFLNPLVAGAVIILESEASEKNPCVAALEKSGAGAEPGKADASSPVERTIEGAGEALKDAGEGAGDALKGVGEGISRGVRGIFNE